MTALGTVTVTSGWTNKPVELPGTPTPVPGLWVARHPRSGYVIAHKPSRRIVGQYPDAEAALACAADLGALADWAVQEEPTMHAPMALIEQIDAVVKRWGGNGIEVVRRCGND